MAKLTAGDYDYTVQFSYKENGDLSEGEMKKEMIAC